MENRLPEYTPVRHKKAGYKGWIHSTTKMSELFTGQKKYDWQYTITVEGLEEKKVAPGEDLEVIMDSREFPPFLRETKNLESGYIEETALHMLGYRITDMSWDQRWNILINVGIPILGPLKVVSTITNLIYTRLSNVEMAERNQHALLEWRRDLDMVLDRFGDDSELDNPELLEYVNNTKNKMATFLSL